MLDSVHLEELGIPTVTFVTDPFAAAARTLARIHGIAELPLIVVAADYLENSDGVIREHTHLAMDDVLAGLFGR